MYNEFSNMDSCDVLGMVRNMNYKGYDIHYYTGLCKDEVYISMTDVLEIISDDKRTKLNDIDNILIKAGIIPEYIKYKRPYFIENYINNQCVIYTAIIKICEYYGMKDLKIFLTEAVKMINDIGLYVEGLKFNYKHKEKNREPNVADTLRKKDVEIYFNNSDDLRYDYTVNDVYREVIDRISYLVFNTNISDLRWNLNLNYDDTVSSAINNAEYNELCIASKIYSYMLAYNYHLELDYVDYLIDSVLKIKCNKKIDNNIVTGEFEEEEITTNPYIDTFKRLDYNAGYDENDDDDIDDFTRYM